MAARSDSKDRMISAARRLFREHGYIGTAMSDVIAESQAPRGSLYFHFPGGKEELATEVVLRYSADVITHINRTAGRTDTAQDFVTEFLAYFREDIVASDYREGCAVAPIVVESTPASKALTDVISRGFRDVIATLTARLVEKAVPDPDAEAIAINILTSMEGALILCRVLRSPGPFDAAISMLTMSLPASAGPRR
ncbi:TetR/AcrR family transcriptional regulator [Mycolicibacterium sp.]|uniref:TetR/AcrR family transcriptional regulator n=1 Tax=Mycolicibacterium sp. TaxID=2320850 RepID=UPI003D12DEE4